MSSTQNLAVIAIISLVIGSGVGYFLSPKTDLTPYENQINTLTAEKISLESQVNALEDELDDAVSQSQYETLQNRNSDLVSDITDLENTISSLESQIVSKNALIQSLNDQISDLESDTPAPSEEGDPGTSRFTAFDIGNKINCWFTDYNDQVYYADITIVEIKRGNSAWTLIEQANMFNDAPPSGYEYILVKIKFEYTQGPTQNTPWSISDYDFDAVSETGLVYDSPFVVGPSPEFDAELYPGAFSTGWAVYIVSKTDSQPTLAWKRAWGGLGGVWFKIYN